MLRAPAKSPATLTPRHRSRSRNDDPSACASQRDTWEPRHGVAFHTAIAPTSANTRHRVSRAYATIGRTDGCRDVRMGVLTVFRLDRVERGPCQIPASWLWLRFIVKVISTINYPTVRRQRVRASESVLSGFCRHRRRRRRRRSMADLHLAARVTLSIVYLSWPRAALP